MTTEIEDIKLFIKQCEDQPTMDTLDLVEMYKNLHKLNRCYDKLVERVQPHRQTYFVSGQATTVLMNGARLHFFQTVLEFDSTPDVHDLKTALAACSLFSPQITCLTRL